MATKKTRGSLGRAWREGRLRQLYATVTLAAGTTNEGSDGTSVVIPFTRPLTMNEMKLLWDTQNALNVLPLPAGYRIVIDMDVTS